MRVAVSGSHGFIGGAVVAALQARGDEVTRMVRGDDAGPGELAWDPVAGTIDAGNLAEHDAVVHLAGEGVAERRWTQDQKARIRDSRRHGTNLIARAIERMGGRPRVWVSGSGVGYYGDRGDEELTEESAPGSGFLPDVAREWELATRPAEDAGTRVVHIRTGIVLHPAGGVLQKQLPLFKIGIGGPLPPGSNWMAWVSMDDEVGAILHALDHDDLAGPVNVTAPNPVTQRDYATALGRALHRPAVLPVPKPALLVRLGRELMQNLLASQRALPTRLQTHGYEFRHPELEPALRDLVRRKG